MPNKNGDTLLKQGDWVTSFSPGIWRIYRILSYKGIDPVSGKTTDKTTVFSKRFVSGSFKDSFKEECCSPDFVKKLNAKPLKKLGTFIKENESLFKKFENYIPKSIDGIYNARIGIPKGKSAKKTEALISKERMVNELEIEPYLSKLGFATNELPSWTAQFISENHQCQNGFLVYRFGNILKF